jgi:hypothetical protein
VLADDEFVGNNVANDLVVSPDSSTVIVTGYSDAYTAYRYATIAYSASTGAKLWARRYDDDGASAENGATALDASASTVFVTGNSRDPSSVDYATVAYALT